MSIDVVPLNVKSTAHSVLHAQWEHRPEYGCMEIMHINAKSNQCMSMSMSIDIILLKIKDVLYNVLCPQWEHRLEYSCMEIIHVEIKKISCMSINAIFFKVSIDVNTKAEGDFSSL